MGRNAHLSERECNVIIAFHDENLSFRIIAECAKGFRNAVWNMIRNQGRVNKNKPTGAPRQLTDSTNRSIVIKGRDAKCTARMIPDELCVNVGVRRVQQVFVDAQFSEYEKRKPTPRLVLLTSQPC